MHIHLLDNAKCRFQHWEDTSKDWVTGFDYAFQKSNLKRIYKKSTWLHEFTCSRSIIHTTGVSSFHWMAQLVFLKTYVSGGKHCTCCLKTTRAWLLNLCNLNNWCELIDFLLPWQRFLSNCSIYIWELGWFLHALVHITFSRYAFMLYSWIRWIWKRELLILRPPSMRPMLD